jgi:hypothetical protein
MQTRWIGKRIGYDGSQLRAHWILRQTGITGDALVGFRGPCAVSPAEIADIADVAGPGIAGADMVHFVAELFDDGDLERAVLRQRLLSALACEALQRLAPRVRLVRSGDDLWLGRRKLSISIATKSPVSTLIHFAVNVTVRGVPVAAASLQQIGVAPLRFGKTLLRAFAAECASIEAARCKVRGKGEA